MPSRTAPAGALAAIVCLASCSTLGLAQQIKYEKYRLDNGLTVILHEDHEAPQVVVNLWYRVGAKEEPAGRSGFAHLFEHLMFMGTERVPGSDFDNLMEAGGGSNNASTSLDRTNYFSSGPSSLLPTLLWLEADRMEDLGRAMTTEKLDKQRDVVRNEIRQQVENTPYETANEQSFRLMYPKGHPYHEAVYGTHADLEAANVHNVKDFFATFYVPSNCSLVVAGDFEAAKVRPLIAGLFAGLPAGAPVVNREARDWPQPRLGGVVRQTYLDTVEQARVSFVYHSPPHHKDGDAAMDLVGALLAEGKSSRLYRRLVVEEKLAADVHASQNSAVLGSMFQIDVLAIPGADLSRVEAVMDEEIAKLKAGVSAEELSQKQATVELAKLSAVDSLLEKADKLNEYEYFYGEPDSFGRDLDRYRSLTPAAVAGWAAKVLTPESRLVTRVLPVEPGRGESARDKRPADWSVGDFTPPAPRAFTLSSGVKVMVWPKPELPIASATVVIAPGRPLQDNAKAGLASLAADMLEEGAGDLDAAGFAGALESLGGTFSSAAGADALTAGVTVLSRNFDRAAGLLADAVIRPRLAAADFERVHRLHLEDVQQSLNEPQAVAALVANRLLLGDSSPYALPVGGLASTASAVTLEDVRAFHGAEFAPGAATVLVGGDVTVEGARAALERAFGGWKAAGAKHPAPAAAAASAPAAPAAEGLRVYLVDRPDAVQTVIRFAAPAPAMAEAPRGPLGALNTLFGGSFTSRLNQNLREAHGYTYGARSRFGLMRAAGVFTAASAVKADVTGPALTEFLKEIGRLKGGDVTAAEAAKAVQTVRAEAVQSLAGVRGPIGVAAPLIAAGLPYETLGSDLAAASRVSAADLNALAKGAAPLERGVLVLVGDKGLVLEQLRSVKGLPEPVEVTPEGELVGGGRKADGGSPH